MNIEAVVDFLQSGLGEVDTLLPDAGILRVACLKIDEFPAGRFCVPAAFTGPRWPPPVASVLSFSLAASARCRYSPSVCVWRAASASLAASAGPRGPPPAYLGSQFLVVRLWFSVSFVSSSRVAGDAQLARPSVCFGGRFSSQFTLALN